MEQFIETNKEVIIASCDKLLDVCLDAIDQLRAEASSSGADNTLTIEDFTKTIQRVEPVKHKITKGEPLTQDEFILISVVLNSNFTILTGQAERFDAAARQMESLLSQCVEIMQKFNS